MTQSRLFRIIARHPRRVAEIVENVCVVDAQHPLVHSVRRDLVLVLREDGDLAHLCPPQMTPEAKTKRMSVQCEQRDARSPLVRNLLLQRRCSPGETAYRADIGGA